MSLSSSPLYKTLAGEQVVRAIYDQALQNWSAPYDTHCIPTRYGEAFVIASGQANAPPLLLLHGSGSNSAIWAADAGDYSRSYRLYAVDLPGEAGRSAPNRPAWEGSAFADWLEDVLDGLGIKRVMLAGISQGAWTALKFAVAHPEYVHRLVLMSPGGVVPDRKSFLLKAIPLMMLGQWGISRMVDALFGDQPVPEGVKKVVIEITRHYKPRLGVLPLFTDDELRRLTMPVFLLGGAQDVMRDLNAIETRLCGLLPDLTVKLIPGAGHALLNTRGDVLHFLARP